VAQYNSSTDHLAGVLPFSPCVALHAYFEGVSGPDAVHGHRPSARAWRVRTFISCE
jgi:hypothetical protein